MKVLFIVPYVPDLIRVRPYNLIRYLTGLGHKVTVLSLWTNPEDKQAAEKLEQLCHRVHTVNLPRWRSYLNAFTTIPTRTPLQASYCWQPALADLAGNLIDSNDGKEPFDVIHIEHLRGARFGLALQSRFSKTHSTLPIVWDSVDSISYLFRQAMAISKRGVDRLLTRFELSRTERYEGWLVNQFDRTLVTSLADKNALEALAPPPIGEKTPANITVLQNGVDLSYFKPDPELSRDEATLVLSGKMSYHANISMALHLIQDIMPKVWAVREDVRVNIVGKDPPPIVKSLAQSPRVTVTGTVPELRKYLQQASIAVAPITYGAGIQNKILEAMACATPVITTPKAAMGLQTTLDENILVAKDASTFANAILKLLGDASLRRQIGEAGNQYVKKYHFWGEIASQLSNIYTQAIRIKKNGSTKNNFSLT